MPRANGTERRLYRDLSGLISTLRSRPFADLEQAIEAQFRRYLGDKRRSPGDTLALTLSWQLPEGAELWALYGTEFRIEARGVVDPLADPEPDAGTVSDEVAAGAKVIAFPNRPREPSRHRRD